MTLTIELTPEAEERLCRNAAARGQNIQEYLNGVISALPEAPPKSEYEATIALFEEWAKEDALLTPEEAAKEDAEWAEIMANIERNRVNFPVPEV
jgi:hypothetical protein